MVSKSIAVAETCARRAFDLLEWTGDHHLRHSRFIALREGKKAREVKRE